jgi:hypothetical protein
VPKPAITESTSGGEKCDGAIKARRKAYFDGWRDTPIYDRGKLVSGNQLRGPAIIEQMDSTTVVHPGHEARIDRVGNIIIEIDPSTLALDRAHSLGIPPENRAVGSGAPGLAGRLHGDKK